MESWFGNHCVYMINELFIKPFMLLNSRKLKAFSLQIMINECCSLKLLWLTLTQVHSSCEIEFLPVYTPSEEEKHDPKLYANNVRRLMAKCVQLLMWICKKDGSKFCPWYTVTVCPLLLYFAELWGYLFLTTHMMTVA